MFDIGTSGYIVGVSGAFLVAENTAVGGGLYIQADFQLWGPNFGSAYDAVIVRAGSIQVLDLPLDSVRQYVQYRITNIDNSLVGDFIVLQKELRVNIGISIFDSDGNMVMSGNSPFREKLYSGDWIYRSLDSRGVRAAIPGPGSARFEFDNISGVDVNVEVNIVPLPSL